MNWWDENRDVVVVFAAAFVVTSLLIGVLWVSASATSGYRP